MSLSIWQQVRLQLSTIYSVTCVYIYIYIYVKWQCVAPYVLCTYHDRVRRSATCHSACRSRKNVHTVRSTRPTYRLVIWPV